MNILRGTRSGGSQTLEITGTDLEIALLDSRDAASVFSGQTVFYTSSWNATTYDVATILKIKSSAAALTTLSGKTISSVILSLYRTGGYMSEDGNVFARKILRTVVMAQATWNVYSTGNSWGTAGASGAADVDTNNVLGAVGLTDTVTSMFTSSTQNMIDCVSGWVSGSIVNNGMLLFPDAFADYHTWSGPTGANPPVITVTYT